jgi:biopolymer transport protein ExbB
MMRPAVYLLSLTLHLASFLAAPPLIAQPVADPQNQIAPAPALGTPIGTESAPPVLNIGAGLHELSPWSMFLNADIIVKGVMIGLVFASAVTWTVFLAKSVELSSAARRLKGSLRRIANTRSLIEAQAASGTRSGVVSDLLEAALLELSLSEDCLLEAGVKERASSSFSDVVKAEARGIRRGTGLLATIGATAPFVGLFGTVWGIMNSFIGISKAQTTNLAVVAPGIAEALLATAIGLVAAIPAVVIYNHFSRMTKTYLDLVSGASGAVGRLLSRDLDRRSADMSLQAGD